MGQCQALGNLHPFRPVQQIWNDGRPAGGEQEAAAAPACPEPSPASEAHVRTGSLRPMPSIGCLRRSARWASVRTYARASCGQMSFWVVHVAFRTCVPAAIVQKQSVRSSVRRAGGERLGPRRRRRTRAGGEVPMPFPEEPRPLLLRTAARGVMMGPMRSIAIYCHSAPGADEDEVTRSPAAAGASTPCALPLRPGGRSQR